MELIDVSRHLPWMRRACKRVLVKSLVAKIDFLSPKGGELREAVNELRDLLSDDD